MVSGCTNDKTVIFKEFATGLHAATDPYYPINTSRNQELLGLYLNEAKKMKNVLFCDRLGTYQYLDMDQAIVGALTLNENHSTPKRKSL